MGKFRPEMIKVCMQLGYPDESGDNKCDGEPVLHFIMLCSEDEDKDALVIYEDDVQNFKDVSCCYHNTLFRGKQPEIESKLTSDVTEWLTDRTQLPLESCLEISIRIIDSYKDLKDRAKTVLYFNRLGMAYFKNKPNLEKQILDIQTEFLGEVITLENAYRLKNKLSLVLRNSGEIVFPIIECNECKVIIDFKVRNKDVKFVYPKTIISD